MKILSKKLSYVLRHNPQSIGIIPDESGFCNVAELIGKLNADGTEITFSEIEEIVRNDGKNRFSFNADQTKIRANYGHSFPVDLGLTSSHPPDILYHGTGKGSVGGILNGGIRKRKRNYVHLSSDYFTALETGRRHGVSVVFEVNVRSMRKDGYRFYRSGSVWLTEEVPSRYVRLMKTDLTEKESVSPGDPTERMRKRRNTGKEIAETGRKRLWQAK